MGRDFFVFVTQDGIPFSYDRLGGNSISYLFDQHGTACTVYPRDNALIVYDPGSNEKAVDILRIMLHDPSCDLIDDTELDRIWQGLRGNMYRPGFRYFFLTEE